MRINTTTTSTRGKALRRCINPLPTKFSSNSTWTNFHFRISKTKHAPQTKQGANMKLNVNCDVHWAFIFWHFFWEVQMHYLFVYFLSELSMYSDTGVGGNFHRGVEILKIPDNVGWFVPVYLGVKSDWRSWQIETMSSWRRSKSLSPLSNRDEC